MDKRAATQMQRKTSQGLDDVRIEMTQMRSKLDRLNTIVTPLMAITDLSLAKQRMDNSRQFSNGSNNSGGGMNVNMLSAEERLQELAMMNP